MGLVGVAGLDRGGRQVRRLAGGVEHADEAPEAEHPLQRLRAVARRGVHPPAELAFAEAYLPGDVFGPRRGVAQQGSGLRDRVVGSGLRDEQAGDVDRPRCCLGRRQAGGQPPGGRRQQGGEGDALVADLAERQAEDGSARGRAEPHADDDRPCLGHGADRPGIRARHVAADALLPDEITARVGQHQGRAVGAVRNHAGPQARHRAAQRRGRRPLRIPRSEPRVTRHPVRFACGHETRMSWRCPFRSIRRRAARAEMVP